MGTKKQTKYETIKNYLLEGNSISQLEAYKPEFGVSTRLSAIIHTMKHRDGIEIESCTEVSPTGAHYSRYWVSKKYLEQMHDADLHAND